MYFWVLGRTVQGPSSGFVTDLLAGLVGLGQ